MPMTIGVHRIPIIRTKLYRPPVVEDIVCRKKLHKRLDGGLKLPLTLVSATAGYGKSTLISHWLEVSGLSCAWLSLDHSDSDLRTFLCYFVAAVQTLDPKACCELQAVLDGAGLPAVSVLTGLLANALDVVKTRFVLVLDDYHRIDDLSVHELIDGLLQHPPRPLHLVIVSRRNPPLSLAAFRAAQRVTEIHLADLKFTSKESSAFLKKVTDRKLGASLLLRVHERTEGWPVGLRLSAIALLGRDDLDGFLTDLNEGLGSMQDYLINEILGTLTQAERECVCRASILDRFCTSLCQALCEHQCGRDCSREQINSVIPTTASLLIISLDDQNVWHRYHHLFQQLLRQQLDLQCDVNEIAALHLRAAHWLEKNDCLDDALQHALEGSSPEEAGRLMIRHRNAILNEEQWPWLDKWLYRLPTRLVEKQVDLLLLKAWFFDASGRWEEVFETVAQIEALLKEKPDDAEISKELIAGLDAIIGLRQWFSGQGAEAVEYAERALKGLPNDCFMERGQAVIVLVIAHQMLGTHSLGRDMAMKYLSDFSGVRATTFHSRVFAALSLSDWMDADLPALNREGVRLRDLGVKKGLPESLLAGRYFVGIASYCRNELKEAELNLVSVVEEQSPANTEFYAQSAFALASLYQGSGRPEEAVEIVERMLIFGIDTRNASFIQCTEAFEADLALRQGRMPKAVKWVAQYDPYPFFPFYKFYAPQLTCVRIRLAQGDAVNRKEAELLLTRLEKFVRQTHNVRFLIDVLCLKALLAQKEDNDKRAIKQLSEAITQARPGGVIRPFVDLSSGLIPLLSRIDLDEEGVRFVGRILAAMQVGTTTLSARDAPSGLLEPLSSREFEILALMAGRLSNKEIGAQLFIAPGTVKRHTENIYQKLAVHSRRDAVIKADGLGILKS